MKRILISILILCVSAGMVLLVGSCAKETEIEEEASAPAEEEYIEPEIPGETVTETEELSAVEAPSYHEAFVIFSSGIVDYKPSSSDEWLPVEIGQTLTQDDSLRVDDASYCEVQFGESAVVKVKEATTISLSQVYLKEGERSVKVKMEGGSVLNRVEKLAGGEKFKVQTPSAVCGVRGTQFGVEAGRDNTTKVSVKTGAVAVQPGSVDTEDLKEKIAGKNDDLEEAVDALFETAAVVTSNQEFDVDEETAKETDQASIAVAEVVDKMTTDQETAPTKEEIEEAGRIAAETKENIVEKQVAPKEMSREKNEELKEIDEMKLLDLSPVETAAEKETKEGEEPQAVSEAPRKLVLDLHKVAVEVEPKNALIRVNGKERGRGSFSGVYNSGEELAFEIRREDFETHRFDIQVSKETAKLYRIKLAKKEKAEPLTEDFEIRTLPEDAEILVNGEPAGTGSFSESYLLGKSLSFTVRKEGYKENKIDVKVSLGSGKTYTVDLERKTERVEIRTTPADSRIFVNGRQAGIGSFEDDFPVGESLDFEIRKDGWKNQDFSLDVREGETIIREISLEQLLQGVQIGVVPRDARILLDGLEVGRGSFTDHYEAGTELSFELRREGYIPQTLDFTVTDELQSFQVSLERLQQRVSIRALPADAQIIINGRSAGSGPVSRTIPTGRALSISARRAGYQAQTVSYTTGSGGEKSFTLKLEPLPLQFVTEVTNTEIIGSAVALGNLTFTADSAGRIFAVDRDGKLVWEASTENEKNQNSYPVIVDGAVYFTGGKELVKLHARSGSVLHRNEFSGAEGHIFGRRVAELDGKLLIPATGSIRIVDPSDHSLLKEIPVPGGSRMTPATWKGKIVTVNQQGSILILNPDNAAVEKEIPSGGVQPVAQQARIIGDLAVFSGRKGTVVCADLSSGKVRWEKQIPGDSVSVFSDPECSSRAAFLFSNKGIYGFSMEDGRELFSPIVDAAGPPLYKDGSIYFGSEKGGLTEADAATGRETGGVKHDMIITTRPVENGISIIAGTRDGTILIMSP